jgi:hypothetical protein
MDKIARISKEIIPSEREQSHHFSKQGNLITHTRPTREIICQFKAKGVDTVW